MFNGVDRRAAKSNLNRGNFSYPSLSENLLHPSQNIFRIQKKGVHSFLTITRVYTYGIADFIKNIGVKSIDKYIEKAKSLGGKIIMPKTTIPGFGYLSTFIDTEGNTIGLWETDPTAKM